MLKNQPGVFGGILLTILFCFAPGISADDMQTIYLVRHAEKVADGGRDPDLTDRGRARAAWLARYLSDKDISAVYSSNTARTRDTATPTAVSLGLDVMLYDPRRPADIANTVLMDGRNTLIVGHSNTTNKVINSLLGTHIEDLDESLYSLIFIVRVPKAGVPTLALMLSDPRQGS